MQRIIGILCLLGLCATAGAESIQKVPPEKEIKTTLVIDSAIATVGGKDFGFRDIVVLDGIHVEQEDAFGNITTLVVGDDGDTYKGICALAGYQAGGGDHLTPYQTIVKVTDRSVIRYTQGDGFYLADSDEGLTRTACVNEAADRAPGQTRLPTPKIIKFELSADAIERLILPTGGAYIRIVNPRIDMTDALYGASQIQFPYELYYDGSSNGWLWDQACKLFGYKESVDVDGVTSVRVGGQNELYWDIGQNPRFWVYFDSGRKSFDVLTCIP